MKKIRNFAIHFMAIMSVLCLAACSDDNSDGVGTNDDPALNASDAKKELEAVANELMSKVSADDFQNFADMSDGIADSDDDVVSDWFDDCVESCKLSGSTDDDLKYLYAASNFTGKFELVDGRWKKVGEADYLQFSFDDNTGKSCVLKAETSGSKTTVHHDSFDEEDYYYKYVNGRYREYTTIEENSIVIPENIHVTLTQGGSTVADVTVNTSVNISSGDFDYTRDNAQVSVTAKINNEYNLTVSKVAFNAGTNASASATLTKGSETLIECSANATGQLYSEESGKDPVGKTGEFKVKVLGNRVYIVGNISNISDLADNLDNADNNDEDESKFKRYIENANALLDINVYFDGSKNSSAKVELYPVSETYYYSKSEYWDYEPCVVFDDGTKYSFEEYFDENTYEDVIDQFEDLIDDFIDMFD